MDKLDQFESAFRAASKEVFHYAPPSIPRAVLVTDLDGRELSDQAARIRAFLAVLGDDWELEAIPGDRYSNVGELLSLVQERDPSIVVTYRHLQTDGWQWPHGLGEYLDVLAQVASCPVLVVPHPRRSETVTVWLENTDVVMAMTDHLTGDDRLVNYAARLTTDGGALLLVHVEDERTFQRYIATIGRIPEIDTETAAEKLRAQLLKEPRDYIESCQAALAKARPALRVEGIVTLGHHLTEHMRLVQERKVDLLVLETKDQDQLAMHGLAYPIAVELRTIPVLML